jgi:hypothetical protein
MKDEDCCCNAEDSCDLDDEEMELEEIVSENNVILNSLIDLLIEKKVISEEDLQKKIDEIDAELEEESDEEELDEDECEK